MDSLSASQKDSIKKPVELNMLKEGLVHIRDLGKRLLLKQSCISTAQYFFSKFSFYVSFRHFDRLVMASACSFLSSKVTEQVVRVRDVARQHLDLKRSRMASQALLSSITEEIIEKTTKEIVFHEFQLLAVLDYQLLVPLPYSDINSLVQSINGDSVLRRVANNFANDCYFSRLVLNFQTNEIATACVQLAVLFLHGNEGLQQPNRQGLGPINSGLLEEIIEIYETIGKIN